MEAVSVPSRDADRLAVEDLRESDMQEDTPDHKGPADKVKFYTYAHQRRTRQKVVSDYASMSKGATTAVKPRAALKQVFFNQGASDRNPTAEEQSQLDVLKQELEAFAVPVSLKWRWREEIRGSTLERNWTDIVNSHSIMSRMQRYQQEALWEFVHTELSYINRLFIIKDLVIAALVNLHLRGFLQEVTPELLFCNLPAILSAHQRFWQEVIFPMLREVRSTGKPFDPVRLEAGCLHFHDHFSQYQHYCAEEENSIEFARKQMESNPHFCTYVQWVETHPQCQRMRIGDMQAKPHQRITKYPLLLKAVLKTTLDLRVQRSLRSMLSSVNTFLESINEHLRVKDEEMALSISAQRLEGYEMEGINEEIDKHVRDVCQFKLTCPIGGVSPEVVRKLLLEENLKVRGRKDSKLEVVALLFSDVLLMTKVQKKGEHLKVVRPPVALDRTYCIALKDNCSFLLVEVGELCCPVNVYVFVTSTPESCSTWVSTINQAKAMLENLREAERGRPSGEKRPPVADRTNDANGEVIVAQVVNGAEAGRQDSAGLSHRRLAIKDKAWRERQSEVHQDEEQSQSLTWKNTNPSTAKIVAKQISEKVMDPFLRTATRPRTLVPGGYPAVDYPMDDLNTSTEPSKKQLAGDFQPAHYSTWQKHNPTQLGNIALSPETENLKSALLHKKTAVNANQDSPPQTVQGSKPTWSASNNSSSNSDSDSSLNTKSSNSHLVLKLGSLKPTHGTFWTTNNSRVSPDPQTLSEPERTTLSFNNKKPRLKTQRSVSNPTTGIPEESSSMSAPPSPLKDLLERAKGRTRDKDVSKSHKNVPMTHLNPRYHPPPSPLLSTSSSPSPTDGDRDAEWEEGGEVQLLRHRALTVSQGWREQLVDGEDDDKMYSPLFTNGVNVDWPGWCFDDKEVMNYLHPGGKRAADGISQSLALCDLSEQDLGPYSQV
ncbi:uncharacterized protein plekhg6 [Dunckerocampus dactyliophorus]|uniref:uncharacterized protein plekhg6 n=1 Tax=Dunckerocampus dactyliophorus TaxID=161453 RepID=UPI002404DDE1|nr:uncharacterized protein plekhg6 [Dunckerocampus dactyliophorus]